jgi:hypothetical protein
MQPPQRPEQRLWRWYRSLYPLTQAGLGCLVLIAALFGCALCAGGLPDLVHGIQQGYEQNQPPPIATDTPTQGAGVVPEWTITHTFTATGSSKTDTFTVADDWQLNWTCTPSSFTTDQTNVTIDIDSTGQNAPVVSSAVNAYCSTDAYSGAVEEHQSGTFYLAVTSAGQWTVQIEQLI